MTTPTSLFLAGRDWLVPAAAAFGVAFLFVTWSYLRAPARGPLRFFCALLKLIGLAALLACLLEPTLSGQRLKKGANILAIVADNSLSLTLHDASAPQSRGDLLRSLVAEGRSDWRTPLTENFDTRHYLADARLQPTQDFHELTFEGRTTALGHTLAQLAERYRGQPLAGIILLTDGIASDPVEVAALKGLPPVYPVLIGHDGPERDLAIANTAVTQTSFEDAPVTVQAEIAAHGFAGEEITAQLFPIAATPGEPLKPIAEQIQTIPREGGKLTCRFQFRPPQSGVLFYRLVITPKKAGEAESTLANNETVIVVDRGSGPHRILYVSGRPNWEYKFLHRAIEGDDQTQLVGLIRIANREPKFSFRGRAGEDSNPLFRGFGDQSKENVERYDQPVFVRLGTEDEFELRGGFPKTAEELFKYRAIILDDTEAEFFTADQMSLVQRFVSERGGGLLALGGAESFREGHYMRSAIGEMLPIYLRGGETRQFQPEIGALKLTLTREGWLQPWSRLRTNEVEESARLSALPGFDVLNHTGEPKPAATVVATVMDNNHEYPALVTQRFGRGRTAALLVGDLWQSGLGDEARQKDLMKAWRQMVRWMVADVPEPIEVRSEVQPDGVSMKLQVRARDPKFLPMENATVSLAITRAGLTDPPLALTAEASPSEPGLYETTYIPRENGGYRVEASVRNDAGAIAGGAAAGWTSDLAAAEFRDLQPNRTLMEQLARQTGGQVLTPDELPAFARRLPDERAPVTETWTQPLWHTPWMLLFALGCLVGEWGLRRSKGLA